MLDIVLQILWSILSGIGSAFWYLGVEAENFFTWFYNKATAVQRLCVIIAGLVFIGSVITLVLWHRSAELQHEVEQLNVNANISNALQNAGKIQANINKLEENQNSLAAEGNKLANEEKNIAGTEANKFDASKAGDHYCRRYCLESVCLDWRNAHPELLCNETGAKPK